MRTGFAAGNAPTGRSRLQKDHYYFIGEIASRCSLHHITGLCRVPGKRGCWRGRIHPVLRRNPRAREIHAPRRRKCKRFPICHGGCRWRRFPGLRMPVTAQDNQGTVDSPLIVNRSIAACRRIGFAPASGQLIRVVRRDAETG